MRMGKRIAKMYTQALHIVYTFALESTGYAQASQTDDYTEERGERAWNRK